MIERRLKKINRKNIVKAGIVMTVLILIIHIAHAITLDRIMEYKEVSFTSPHIPKEMNGYQIAFITDTHAISEDRLKGVVDELNDRPIDLLVLGGDLVSLGGDPWRSLGILSQVNTTDGIYGVGGNHDHPADLFAAMEERAIIPLSNDGLYVRDQFYLAGVEDLQIGHPNIAHALEGSTPEDFILLTSHNPDVTMQQSTVGVDLVLSGHTHGGQMTFFGAWAPALVVKNIVTDYGQRFRSGWALSNDSVPVYVSNGTGGYFPRVFARPQVIIITLAYE